MWQDDSMQRRVDEYFDQRARRVNRAETLRILKKAGKGNAPMEGDELPEDWPGESEDRKRVRSAPAASRKAKGRKRE